jgi:hypothetical protein
LSSATPGAWFSWLPAMETRKINKTIVPNGTIRNLLMRLMVDPNRAEICLVILQILHFLWDMTGNKKSSNIATNIQGKIYADLSPQGKIIFQ